MKRLVLGILAALALVVAMSDVAVPQSNEAYFAERIEADNVTE